MYDSGKILIGLIIFLGLFTSPIWYNLISGEASFAPKLVLPTKADQKECVMSKEYMNRNHMELLDNWRDEVVRDGNRTFIASSNRTFDKSLTNTCLNCHSDKSQFCDKCHDYMDVKPYCWDCHVDPLKLENK